MKGTVGESVFRASLLCGSEALAPAAALLFLFFSTYLVMMSFHVFGFCRILKYLSLLSYLATSLVLVMSGDIFFSLSCLKLWSFSAWRY